MVKKQTKQARQWLPLLTQRVARKVDKSASQLGWMGLIHYMFNSKTMLVSEMGICRSVTMGQTLWLIFEKGDVLPLVAVYFKGFLCLYSGL